MALLGWGWGAGAGDRQAWGGGLVLWAQLRPHLPPSPAAGAG